MPAVRSVKPSLPIELPGLKSGLEALRGRAQAAVDALTRKQQACFTKGLEAFQKAHENAVNSQVVNSRSLLAVPKELNYEFKIPGNPGYPLIEAIAGVVEYNLARLDFHALDKEMYGCATGAMTNQRMDGVIEVHAEF